MSADSRIDYLEFPAENLELTKRFYSDVFQWKFEDYGPNYCAFEDGRLTGGFFRSDKRASVDAGSVLVVIYADDLKETAVRVRTGGGTIVRDIFDFPGGRRFHFTDPSGNELAVWSER